MLMKLAQRTCTCCLTVAICFKHCCCALLFGGLRVFVACPMSLLAEAVLSLTCLTLPAGSNGELGKDMQKASKDFLDKEDTGGMGSVRVA